MSIEYEFLRPYQSYLLAQRPAGRRLAGFLAQVLSALEDRLRLDETGRNRVAIGLPETTRGLEYAAIQYRVTKQAPWTRDSEVQDIVNHLALVFRRGRTFAFILTESPAKDAISRCFGKPSEGAIGELEPVDRAVLNGAFVDGPARTLWLYGIHGRTTVKPDAKTMSGLDLRDALDPLGDQSYFMSAARSKVALTQESVAIGVAPRRSRIWLSSSSDWTALFDTTEAIFKHLDGTIQGTESPLPVLAIPAGDIANLGQPYEMAIVPPQLLSDDPSLETEQLQTLEDWYDKTEFENLTFAGATVEADVLFGGHRLGALSIGLKRSKDGTVTASASTGSENEKLQELVQHCNRGDWLRIWFDSGNTYAGQSLYYVKLREYPFHGFRWQRFDQFDVTKEKPGRNLDIDEIGKQDSLFCWTVRNWPPDNPQSGWLLCDDGAMELADFIHVDLARRTLTLIHAKGAHSANPDRQLSVSSYEVVSSQAVKCLRWLDRCNLRDYLTAGLGKQIATAAWKDGTRRHRQDFLTETATMTTNYTRKVVILQPHVTTRHIEGDQSRWNAGERNRYWQLMTLLHSTATSCTALGATLEVIGEAIQAPALHLTKGVRKREVGR